MICSLTKYEEDKEKNLTIDKSSNPRLQDWLTKKFPSLEGILVRGLETITESHIPPQEKGPLINHTRSSYWLNMIINLSN